MIQHHKDISYHKDITYHKYLSCSLIMMVFSANIIENIINDLPLCLNQSNFNQEIKINTSDLDFLLAQKRLSEHCLKVDHQFTIWNNNHCFRLSNKKGDMCSASYGAKFAADYVQGPEEMEPNSTTAENSRCLTSLFHKCRLPTSFN